MIEVVGTDLSFLRYFCSHFILQVNLIFSYIRKRNIKDSKRFQPGIIFFDIGLIRESSRDSTAKANLVTTKLVISLLFKQQILEYDLTLL
jgi:hypothetical protein